MSQIINIFRDPHRGVQELLPWYVTGTLDAMERSAVEAHLANCAECREELAIERDLSSEIAALPWDSEAGWNTMRRRMQHSPSRPGFFARAGVRARQVLARPGRFGWLLAGQVAFAAVVVAMVLPSSNPAPHEPALYRTLGNPAASGRAAGNVIVIFRPDAREEVLRRVLQDNHARLVDGPTAAGAYVLRVPAAQRADIVAALQTEPHVVLAQPVDAGAQP